MRKRTGWHNYKLAGKSDDDDDDDHVTHFLKALQECDQVREARFFCSLVRSSTQLLQDLYREIYTVMDESIKNLKVLQFPEPAGLSSVFLSRAIVKRQNVFAKVSRIRPERYDYSLAKICHLYRAAVKHTSAHFESRFDPASAQILKQLSAMTYTAQANRALVDEITKDMANINLGAIPGLKSVSKEWLSTFAFNTKFIVHQIATSSGNLLSWRMIELGGETLGHVAGYVSWAPIAHAAGKIMNNETSFLQMPPLFPLSAQYPDPLAQALFYIEDQTIMITKNLGSINVQLKDVREWRYKYFRMLGKRGDLEPRSVGTQFANYTVAQISNRLWRREFKVLCRWGYRPSKWYRSTIERAMGNRPFAEPTSAHSSKRNARQSEREKHRAQRKKFLELLDSPVRVRYCYISSFSPRTIRKHKAFDSIRRTKHQLKSLRSQLRMRRQTALGKMRKVLTATLLAYQDRSKKRMHNVDWLTSLSKLERPSSSTQLGGFIGALGFYDKPKHDNTDIKTNYPKKTKPRKNKPRQMDLCSSAGSNNTHMQVHLQRGFQFTKTPRMRAPHPSNMPFDTSTWGQGLGVQATDTSGQVNEGDRGSFVSNGGDGKGRPNTGTHPSNAKDLQPPYEQSNAQISEPPNRNTNRETDGISSNKSERESEPEHKVNEESDGEEAEEHHTSLTYQISPEALQFALQSPPLTRASFWSPKLYRGPENEKVLLHYCSNMKVSERVAKHFLDEKVVGFDIEWKPFGSSDSVKENVSMIQIASESRIALFHIAQFPGKDRKQLMPPTLKVILESSTTLKAGVAAKGDCKRVEKYFGVRVQGVFEISRLHNLVQYHATEPSKVNRKLVGLAKQVQQHLLLPLYKGQPLVDEPQGGGSVRLSDWSRPVDFEQMHYAAADAYAGLHLFDVLESKRKKLNPPPPIPSVCDFDDEPAPRVFPKTKRLTIVKEETEDMAAGALGGLNAEDTVDETYETAAEQLVQEGEDAASDLDSYLESFDAKVTFDGDHVPNRRSADTTATSEAALAHCIGRVNFARLTSTDPGYLKPPALSSKEELSSEIEEASSSTFFGPSITLAKFPACSEQNESNMQDEASTKSASSAAAPTPTATPLIRPDSFAHSPEYCLATAWAQAYLASTIPLPSSTATPRKSSTIPSLRAYHLWHHRRFPVEAIGAHLRDPPLARSTVCNYIIQAIIIEKLEYRDADLVALMSMMPASLRLGRYAWLSRRLGIIR